MSEEEIKDITIIGAGPSGLFAAFQAGMYEESVRIIDSISEPGGQLSALYPEKYIFDAPGFPKITAKDLVKNLFNQADQFSPELRLNEKALEIVNSADVFHVKTDKGLYLTKTVIIAAGFGAFKPRTLGLPDIERFEGRGVYYFVRGKNLFKGKDVVIVGGGDSAIDWALNLIDTAGEITLVHRKETFRAHPDSVRRITEYSKTGRIKILTPYEVKSVTGTEYPKEVIITDLTGKEVFIKANHILLLLGFTSDLGPIENWGVDIEDSRIKVDINMETNRKGIFAVGDIANYPGKLKLILTGFSDAAQAVRRSVPYVRPRGKMRDIHSTSLKVFDKQS